MLSNIIQHSPYLGLFVLILLGGVGFPFPEDSTLILCGFLISTKIINPFYALLVVYISLLISDFILYSFGKKYGRMVVTHTRFQKIISSEKLLQIETKFKKRGTLVILIGRHLAGLRAQIFLVAGIMSMNPIKFLIVDAISVIFTIAVMVGVGYLGGNSLQILKKDLLRIEHIVILLGVITFLTYLLWRYFRFRKSQ